MIVLKFGGSSVDSAKGLSTICDAVRSQIELSPCIVVSALKGTTNALLRLQKLKSDKEKSVLLSMIKSNHEVLIRKLWNERDGKTRIEYINDHINSLFSLVSNRYEFSLGQVDEILSFGEELSSFIVTEYLNQQGIYCQQVMSKHLIVTNTVFGNADCILSLTEVNVKKYLTPLLRQKIVPVITGFIGATIEGETTTLGRNGSDQSAAIIGACLRAKEIQIWTDVDGILSADPKIIKNAKSLKLMTYEMAEAFAISGAKVLHPKTIKPAAMKNIPIKVLNTFNPTFMGTLVIKDYKINKRKSKILGIALENISEHRIRVHLLGYRLNTLATQKNIKLHLGLNLCKEVFDTSRCRISFSIDSPMPENIVKKLHKDLIL